MVKKKKKKLHRIVDIERMNNMQSENKKRVSAKGKINGSQWSDDSVNRGKGKQKQYPMQLQVDSAESFYNRLSELYESWGLNLVFNARETMLDLHLFYKEVTVRGGFHLYELVQDHLPLLPLGSAFEGHVTKDRRWDEVAFALKLEGNNMKFHTQLQILYALFLYKFELTYFYREPAKAARASDCSGMKRKSGDNLFDFTTIEDNVVMKKMCKDNAFPLLPGPRTAEPKLSPQTPSKNKETKKRPGAQRGLRTAYHIFMKEECTRLRTAHGDSLERQNVREMALVAWRSLSERERQPYIEESMKERERVKEMATFKEREKMKEMAAFSDCQNLQITKTHETCLDGDYHVTLETEVENFLVPDESTVNLAITMMNDPILQIDCFGSLDVPAEGSNLL
uniref:HMG box domain-containing protein n=1 Tax=Quercus lobata TaxID=97700 RepID=A0A7N2R0W2_QUELO